MRRSTPLAFFLALALPCWACDGSGPADGPDDEASDATDPDIAQTGPADLAGDTPRADAATDTVAPGGCPDGTTVTIITGEVVDTAGTALEGARAQACVREPGGRLVCLRPGETGADGRFAQSVPFETQCMAGLTLRVLRPPSPFATSYCPLELAPGGSPVLALSEPLVLLPTAPATDLPDAGDGATRQTVVFTDGLELEVAPQALYFGGSAGWSELAASLVPLDTPGLCALPPDAARPRQLVAFYPEADVTDASATLRLPATEAHAPGTTFDVEVLGGLDCRLADGSLVPEGTWASAGQATVSADGSMLEIANVPCLTWLRVL